MERREFLFVQSTTERGGAETVLLNALASSAELRSSSGVVTLGFGNGDLPARVRSLGVPVVELAPARLRSPIRAGLLVRAVAGEARRMGARVLVGNGAHPQVFAGLASRCARAKSAYFVHMIHRSRLASNHPIDILAVRGPCDVAIANSRASLLAMKTLRPGVRHELLYPGTPPSTVTPDDVVRARGELGAGPGDHLFGIFGRLQRWKGQDVFVKAAAVVAAADPKARFAVVGGSVFDLERDFATEVKRTAAQLGIMNRVVFTGHRGDVGRLMAACDVVCHSSREPEPFGMVIIEAMAHGRAVIATRGGGPSEIIGDSECGLLVQPGDAGALSAAMLRLAGAPDLCATLGATAQRRAAEEFSSERFAARLLAILAQLA